MPNALPPKVHEVLPTRDANAATLAFLKRTMNPNDYATIHRAISWEHRTKFLTAKSPRIDRLQRKVTVEQLAWHGVRAEAIAKLQEHLDSHGLSLRNSPFNSLGIQAFNSLNNSWSFGERIEPHDLERKHFEYLVKNNTESTLMRRRYFGPKRLAALKAVLESLGLSLRKT